MCLNDSIWGFVSPDVFKQTSLACVVSKHKQAKHIRLCLSPPAEQLRHSNRLMLPLTRKFEQTAPASAASSHKQELCNSQAGHLYCRPIAIPVLRLQCCSQMIHTTFQMQRNRHAEKQSSGYLHLYPFLQIVVVSTCDELARKCPAFPMMFPTAVQGMSSCYC